MNAETRKMIDEWHASDQHQDIIDTLDRIPDKERDFEIIGILARAYNNVEEYARAIELLESVKEKGKDDFAWNFRIGYAYYYQDRLDEALSCFKKAHELNEDDEYTKDFIRLCNKELPLSKRVERFWDWFVSNEKELSEMLCADVLDTPDDIPNFVREGTDLISENIDFDLSKDHEFRFKVNGCPDLFIIYPYIISLMPDKLKSKWKFFPFKQGDDSSLEFRIFGSRIDIREIMVKISYFPDYNYFDVIFYDKSFGSLSKASVNKMLLWFFIENTLGENITSGYINEIRMVGESEDGMIPLPELRNFIIETVKEHGHKFFENPNDYYRTYNWTPQESDQLRFDIKNGTTCLGPIISEYYNDSSYFFDHINSFGASALYITFPNVNAGNNSQNLRYEIEARLKEEILEPLKLGKVIGGATGEVNSYIDLLVFDKNTFLDKIRLILKQYSQHSFFISDFRRNAEVIQLTDAKIEKNENINICSQ